MSTTVHFTVPVRYDRANLSRPAHPLDQNDHAVNPWDWFDVEVAEGSDLHPSEVARHAVNEHLGNSVWYTTYDGTTYAGLDAWSTQQRYMTRNGGRCVAVLVLDPHGHLVLSAVPTEAAGR